MSRNPLGLSLPTLPRRREGDTEFILVQRPLQRVLAFLGHSIDDVCTNPIVKRQLFGYFKLYKQIQRSSEISELERWWNPLCIRPIRNSFSTVGEMTEVHWVV